MAKKNSLKFIFDSPVVLVFSVVSTVIFISDLILKLNLSEKIFECPGAKSVPAFDFKSALSYVKLVIYPFGGENSTSFFLNIGFILLLGCFGRTLRFYYACPYDFYNFPCWRSLDSLCFNVWNFWMRWNCFYDDNSFGAFCFYKKAASSFVDFYFCPLSCVLSFQRKKDFRIYAFYAK